MESLNYALIESIDSFPPINLMICVVSWQDRTQKPLALPSSKLSCLVKKWRDTLCWSKWHVMASASFLMVKMTYTKSVTRSPFSLSFAAVTLSFAATLNKSRECFLGQIWTSNLPSLRHRWDSLVKTLRVIRTEFGSLRRTTHRTFLDLRTSRLTRWS